MTHDRPKPIKKAKVISPAPGQSAFAGERLAKRIASAGVCSRREAEKLILSGDVRIGGVVVKTPALNVTEKDQITVYGQPLEEAQTVRLFAFHKPIDMVVTENDPHGRITVFQGLPKSLPRLISVGRLDINSEGLLLLTTSGALSRYLELPATGLPRTYRVRAFGRLHPDHIARMQRGTRIAGIQYGPIKIELEKQATGKNQWWRVTLSEGKNREVRKVLAHFGLAVNRLIRLSYGPFGLGDLPRGALVEIPVSKIKRLIPDFFSPPPSQKPAP